MRLQARERGTIESGFERAPEGWHIFKVDEPIDYLTAKKKEGEDQHIAVNSQGDKLWKITLLIDDEDDAANGIKLDQIVAENKRGEQIVTDFLGATGLFPAFQKAFPGDVSIFTDKVMEKVKGKLAGQLFRGKVKHNPNKKDPDNPYANLVGFGKMSDTIEKLEADLFPEKKAAAQGKGGGKTTVAAVVADDEPF
jgi:hypothetical protein